MSVEPQEEHRWLERLVGEWTYESEAEAAPGEPPLKDTGTESVRSLGGVWVVCEGRGELPGGGTQTTLMTLGYDPAKQRYVGTFVGSMMPQMWIYEGEMDPASGVLALDSEGPSYTTEGETARYRDRIELRSDDHRVMTSSYLGDDGEWHEFMTSHYRRKK